MFNTVSDATGVDRTSGIKCPLCGTFGFAEGGHSVVGSSVSAVLRTCYPSAVVWVVSTIIVLAVNLKCRPVSVAFCPLFECSEAITPSVAHANAPPAVVVILRVCGVTASFDHCGPDGIEARLDALSPAAMFGPLFSAQSACRASTRSGVGKQFVCSYRFTNATNTFAWVKQNSVGTVSGDTPFDVAGADYCNESECVSDFDVGGFHTGIVVSKDTFGNRDTSYLNLPG